MNRQNSTVHRFGNFRLDVGRRLLFKDEETVALPPKAFDILQFLVKSGGNLVGKDELMQAVWQDSFVEDNNLTVNMTLVRKALGEKRGENKFIATVPGRGYRFVADVFEDEADDILILEKVSTTDVFIKEEFVQNDAEILVTPTQNALLLPPKPKSNRKYLLAVAAVLLLVLCGGIIYFAFAPRKIESLNQIQTLAVLPFKPLAMNEQDAIFGLGMSDAVIAKLSRIKRVTIRPTTAITKYAAQNKDLTIIGNELKVDALLDGKIQRDGDKLRVSVQLIRVSDGSPIWANSFDAKESDVFTLQDSISEQVADLLALKLNDEERRQINTHSTENAEAYKLYLNGLFQLGKRNFDSVKLSISYFEQAIEKQPDYALAYAGLADAYMLLGNQEALLGGLPPSETLPKAKSALTKALNLDKNLAEAYATKAWLTVWETGDADLAIQDLRRALEINPNLSHTHHYYGIALLVQGKFDESLAEMKKAQEIDQFSLIVNLNIGTVLFRAKRYDEAETQARKTLELDPNFARGYWLLGLIEEQQGKFPEAILSFQRAVELSGNGTLALASLAHAYAKSGNRPEAEKILGELLKNQQTRYVAPDYLAMIYTALGDKDKAFAQLERAAEDRPFSMFQLDIEQRLAELKTDPRFQKIKAEMQKNKSK